VRTNGSMELELHVSYSRTSDDIGKRRRQYNCECEIYMYVCEDDHILERTGCDWSGRFAERNSWSRTGTWRRIQD
jgi:hypothetical protein